ncbi:Kazal-type serine protease inhibitor domain-containing protein [Oricola thermophila]|uniref:Kazal-like domain-containing protein n=1 Tax=Oricola thermophila TaxID=2742145 RepID=A0A6N1V9D2_9HYPH|nr:Kazal-type serine protease inhibitor domain-containing protein [Oricola thermophila]QKV17123.1 hypothetical protein HTY61_00910 [Oricola thermophila]
MKALTGRRIAALGIALAMAPALAACERTISPPPANSAFCPEVYQPVCARTPSGRRTFPNACTAETEGFRAYAPGECQPGGSERICPMILAPVCAERAGQLATYPNDCTAASQGARVVRQGPC